MKEMLKLLGCIIVSITTLNVYGQESKPIPNPSERPSFISEPFSVCFEGLKTSSTPRGWGFPTDAKRMIFGDGSYNYNVAYRYNEGSKKFTPVITRIDGDEVTIITPKGATKTTGKSCEIVSNKTSVQMIANWIANSDKNLDNMYAVSKKLNAHPKDKALYDRNFAIQLKEYKRILGECKNSGFPEIDNAAKSALKKLAGSSSSQSQPNKSGGTQ